ncbi:MAG TPA: ParB N-terminal domain-containing protein [Candidatus Saccharimonadales bacterium]|nr:ParB N-terminal domain-containing protein [Candidatus Saccharimonadales bacterium]
MSASHVQIAELIEVSLDDINIPPGNHRQDLGDLNGLAESILTIGLVQPITVRQRDAGGYELVAGQRRLAAAGRTEHPPSGGARLRRCREP